MRSTFLVLQFLLLAFLIACSEHKSANQTEDALTVQEPESKDVVRDKLAIKPQRATDTLQAGTVEPSISPDSIEPRKLEVEFVGASKLRFDPDDQTQVDTLLGHFLWIRDFDAPRLLYRAAASDTVWTELNLNFDEEHTGDQQVSIIIEKADLDGKGQKEVLVTMESGFYGSGGGTRFCSNWVIDVTPREPLLLLQAFTSEIDEAFPAYAAMHGHTLDPEDIESGCNRAIKLRRHEIVVGPIETIGRATLSECTLTKLPAGRYCYKNNKVFRVGK